MRLAQWAKHNGGDPALLSEPYRAGNEMMAARYKLSGTGRKIMRHGLTGIAQGAPLPAWGVTAYDPAAPWGRGGWPLGAAPPAGSESSPRKTARFVEVRRKHRVDAHPGRSGLSLISLHFE